VGIGCFDDDGDFVGGGGAVGGKCGSGRRFRPAHQWALEDLYPSDPAWRQAKDELAGRLDGILGYKGKLTDSPAQLLSCLTLNSEMSKAFGRLHSYAHMKSDQDTRDATYLAMKQEIERLVSRSTTRGPRSSSRRSSRSTRRPSRSSSPPRPA
jgi:hypothetical protein